MGKFSLTGLTEGTYSVEASAPSFATSRRSGVTGLWGFTGDKPYIGNFGNNSLLYLLKYQAAPPGTPLADRAKTGTNALSFGMNPDRLFEIFSRDVQMGVLLRKPCSKQAPCLWFSPKALFMGLCQQDTLQRTVQK